MLAIFMGVVVYFLGFIKLPSIITLVIQIIVGGSIYIVMSMIFHLESFEYLSEMLKSLLNRK